MGVEIQPEISDMCGQLSQKSELSQGEAGVGANTQTMASSEIAPQPDPKKPTNMVLVHLQPQSMSYTSTVVSICG